VIRAAGPVSRVELARLSSLTPASVSNIVRVLLESGLVEEAGQSPSTGGKRRTMLRITANARCGIGIHVESDQIIYAMTNMAGGLIGRQRRQGAAGLAPEALLDRLCREVDEFIGHLGILRGAIVGVGVVSSGSIDYYRGTLGGFVGNSFGSSLPLRDQLSAALGLPVVIDRDSTAAAVGEFWGGGYDQPPTFSCIYMGDGIGSATVYEGVPVRGASSNAGEIGHVSLDRDGEQCYCGNRGCLEQLAAPRALVSQNDSGVTGLSTAQAFDSIARQAVHGDAAAESLIRESARSLAAGAVTLANMADIDLIVLAGPGFAIAGAIYVTEIREAIAERAFARSVHPTEVRLATNPRDSAALGASALVLQQLLAPRI
jgi:predicted NBD/HSP70 family sugar kinase